MQTIVLDKAAIDAIDLTRLVPYVEWHDHHRFFPLSPGQEHYKLLAYLSTQMRCRRILDIGTYLGHSATALSFDPSKEVLTFDVADWIPGQASVTSVKHVGNVTCSCDDYMEDLADLVVGCDLVMIDIDHSGRTEALILQRLRDIKYSGLVLLDDINLNDEMRALYAGIPEHKVDATVVGHWSGTALVVFDETRFEIQVQV